MLVSSYPCGGHTGWMGALCRGSCSFTALLMRSNHFGLAHATGVHERNTVPMHETQFRGEARIVCQTQGKARFWHVSGTGVT